MLICLHWEHLWTHWTKRSTKEILNNQPKADTPLLDYKITEISHTCISPHHCHCDNQLAQAAVSVFPHISELLFTCTQVTASLYFCFMLQNAEHPKSPFGLSGRQLLGARGFRKQITPFSPLMWIQKANFRFRSFFFFNLAQYSSLSMRWVNFLPSKRSKITSSRLYSRMTRIRMPQILCAITRKLFYFLNVT